MSYFCRMRAKRGFKLEIVYIWKIFTFFPPSTFCNFDVVFFFESIVRLVSGTIPGDFLYQLRYLSSSLAAFAVYMCHCLYTLHRLPWYFVVGAFFFGNANSWITKHVHVHVFIFTVHMYCYTRLFLFIRSLKSYRYKCRWGILDTCMKLNS